MRHSDGTETHTVRTVIELECDGGSVGIGEFGNQVAADAVAARSPFAVERLRLSLAR